jgi:hypothetical protein
MSAGVDNIRTIAKTALLEEKIALAQAAADSANTSTNPTNPGERGTTVENGILTQTYGTANGPPPDGMVAQKLYAGYDPSGGVGTIDQALYMITQAAASPLNPNLLNAGSDKLTQSQSMSGVSTTGLGGSGGGAGGGGLSTDMSGAATTGATNTGGSNTTALAQGAPNDTILSGMVTAATANGASASDIANMKADYLAGKYGEPGIVTAKQIGDANSNTPSNNIYKTGANKFSDTASYALPEKLKGVVGFDKNKTVSGATGKVLTSMVRIGQTPQYIAPTLADSNRDGQLTGWTDPENPPTYPNFTAGTQWRVNGFDAYLAATPSQSIDIFIQANRTSGFPQTYWDPSTLTFTGTAPSQTAHFTFYTTIGGGPHTTSVAYQNACTIGTANCPTTAPKYTYWPRTGSFTLNWIGAQIYSSVFDSETPISYQTATSTVRLAMGDGSTVIDTRFLDIQPGIQGGYVLSTIAADGVTVNSVNLYDANGVLVSGGLTAADLPYILPPR